jgi:hypothetical protein
VQLTTLQLKGLSEPEISWHILRPNSHKIVINRPGLFLVVRFELPNNLIYLRKVERATGVEPATSSLGIKQPVAAISSWIGGILATGPTPYCPPRCSQAAHPGNERVEDDATGSLALAWKCLVYYIIVQLPGTASTSRGG